MALLEAPPRAIDVSMSTRPTKLVHLGALDGLRGLAVAGVLLFHAGHLKGGFLGVDLFFTLSGFLITTLLLTEHARTGVISLGAFWGRRARRLLPAVLVLLLAVAGYTAIWARPSDLPGVRKDGLAALFYVANWRSIFGGTGYWDQFKPKSPFDHLWSLSIEEQFYVVWPLIVTFCLWKFRGRLRPLAVVTVGALWASVLAMVIMHHSGDDPNRVYLGTDTRVASILVGAVVAITVARFPQRMANQPQRNELVGIGALVALVLSWFVIDGVKAEWLYEGGLLVHAVLTGIVIGVAYGRRTGPLARVLSVRPLRWLGKVSYGLYLWHWPIYWVMNPFRMGFGGYWLTFLRLVVSTIVATASYRHLEAPIRRGRLAKRTALTLVPVTIGLCVVSLLAATIAPALPVARSLPLDPVPTTAVVAPLTSTAAVATSSTVAGTPTTVTPPTTVARTTTTLAKVESLLSVTPADVKAALPNLRTPTAANPLRVLLVGDSFMFDAAPGIAAALTATGVVNVVDGSAQGFTLGRNAWRELWPASVANNRPELIITLWGTFDSVYFGDDANKYTATFNEAMNVLVGNGASVAIIGIPPSTSGGGVNERKVSRDINELFASQVTAHVGRLVYIDPDPIVAPKGEAVLSIDTPTGKQRVRKIDLHHFCTEGSARFGDAVLALLAPFGVATPSAAAWREQLWRFDRRYNDPPGACQ
jgi:peptidoglycan/LPS O-acetylase OafA/YrhL